MAISPIVYPLLEVCSPVTFIFDFSATKTRPHTGGAGTRRNRPKYTGWTKKFRRFRAARRGSAAIEFAIIAPIFVGLLIAVLEIGIFFFAQNILQAAAIQVGRLILTGQAQTTGLTQSGFANDACPSIQAFFTCANLMVDVQSYSSFSGALVSTPTLSYDAHGNVTNSWNYSPGTAGQIVVVRLMYQWPIITGPFAFILPNVTNGTSLIMGVTAFRVEPY
jgi:Flp pilus assembly protein TadG